MNSVPRAMTPILRQALGAAPVVVVTGARQTGKSTLVRELAGRGRTYRTLDDLDVRERAAEAPEALLRGQRALTLDEVQRVPEVLHAIKIAVDRERVAGRFLLTGSANLLLMQRVSESLAGRAVYLFLGPMTRSEIEGRGGAGRWSVFFEEPEERWIERLASDAEPADWKTIARRGGLPVPALELRDARQRELWFAGYARTYLERDLQELSNVSSLVDFRRLMQACAHRVGQLVNQSELGRDVGLPQPTVHRYLNLLETSHLLVRLPPYSVNRTKRLIKSPKLYWADVGLALHLAQEREPRGAHFESVVLQELQAWCAVQPEHPPQLMFWRTASGAEVDFVVESGDRLLPIEVKAGARVRGRQLDGIRGFLDDYADHAPAGLVIHTGSACEWLDERVLGVPWWMVF